MDAIALQNMQSDLTRLANHLLAHGLHVCVEERTAQFVEGEGFEVASLDDIGAKSDLVIVMGGGMAPCSVLAAPCAIRRYH